jgi:FixJ family two-component response regulator
MAISILAVDDDHAVRISLSVMFRKWNDLELEVAESAEEAVVMLKKMKYMMMLCDIDMPGMDGLELLEHVVLEYPEMPVVMLTGNQDVSTPVKAFRMGAMDYLQKPMQTADVRQVVDRAMEVRERQTDAKEGIIDIDEMMSMVKAISSEKMGLDKVGASSAKFRKIIEVMNEKLINTAKRGNIHNIFLLSKSGIVISTVTTKAAVSDKDTDIMGSMFNALKEFCQCTCPREDIVRARRRCGGQGIW